MQTTTNTERDLGRVEGKVDRLIDSFDNFEQRFVERTLANDVKHASHEARMTKLETRLLGLTFVVLGLGVAVAGEAKGIILTLVKAAF